MIHEEICTYEVAKLAKENGFQLECIGYYDFLGEFHFNCESAISNKERTFCHNKYNNIWHRDLTDAPTQSLLQRWLREEKGYYVYPFFDNVQLKWTPVIREKTDNKWIPLLDFEDRLSDTYEQALEEGLKYVLENLV